MNNIIMEAVYDNQVVNIEYYQNNTQLLMGAIEITQSSSVSNSHKARYDNPNLIQTHFEEEKISHTYEKTSGEVITTGKLKNFYKFSLFSVLLLTIKAFRTAKQ